MMTAIQTADIIKVYRELVSISVPTSARIRSINDQFSVVYSEWSQRDLEKSEKINFTQNYILSTSDNSVLLKTPPQAIKDDTIYPTEDSQSGKYQAVIHSWKDKKGDEKQFIEIWNSNGRVKNFDVLASEKHGKVYNKDGNFGCLQWSYSEEKVLYVAEKKLPKTKSFFDTHADKTEEVVIRGREHDVCESWGEQLVNKCQPVICILDIKTGSVQVLCTPSHLSCGQAKWSPGDTGVIFIGYNNDPFRLGIKYCTQRQSGLFYFDFESGKAVLLSDETKASRSPVFSPDQSKLVYIDQPIGGAHKQCGRLMMVDWQTKKNEILVDIVHKATGNVFSGLYKDDLPARCWLEDSKNVIIDTYHRSQVVVYCVNVETKVINPVTSGLQDGSSCVLDVYKDRIILSCSAPNQPQFLVIGRVDVGNLEVKWTKLSDNQCLDMLYDIHINQPTIDRTHPKYAHLDYESILVQPKQNGNQKLPLILFPHGGPHGTFDTSFMLYVAGFCRCGFAVLLVNFRGSLGFGQDSVQSLLGNIGDQDVKDVKAAADDVIAKGLVDGNKIFVFGGSHGGFLATHLIGQYPDFFKACCCRNPVTNLAAKSQVTDIPDWGWTEIGLDYNTQSSVLDGKTCEEMWKRSPIRYVDQVKSPLLLMIGKDDMRVPPTQAREYYRALKSRNIKTRLIEYEGNSHPIIKVDSEADSFVNIILWFNKDS